MPEFVTDFRQTESGEPIQFGELNGDAQLDIGENCGQFRIIGGRAMLARELAQRFELGTRQSPGKEAHAELVEPVQQSGAARRGASPAGQFIGDFLEREKPIDWRRRRRGCNRRGLAFLRHLIGKAAVAARCTRIAAGRRCLNRG